MGVQRETFDGVGMAAKTFVCGTQSIRDARQFVHDLLDGTGFDATAATLLTSELATNVVQYARTDFDVVVTISDGVARVEIHDGLTVSDRFRDLVNNPPREVAVSSLRGRGLLLMRATAARFGLIDKGPTGKAIWFETAQPPT